MIIHADLDAFFASKEIEITCSVGVSAQKTVAKIASGFHKPNGITFVKPGTEKQFLAQLNVIDIPGCGRKTQKVLQAIGIWFPFK